MYNECGERLRAGTDSKSDDVNTSTPIEPRRRVVRAGALTLRVQGEGKERGTDCAFEAFSPSSLVLD